MILLEKERGEKKKVQEEYYALWKKEHEDRLRHQKLMEEKGEEINRMLYGNGVPACVFLSVTKDSDGHIVYSLTTLPGKEHVIQNLDSQTRGKWIQLLIQRAEWMEQNYR